MPRRWGAPLIIDLRTEAIPGPVRKVCARLRDRGYRAWIVGGGLRDLLRGQAPKDWDIATSATPQQVRGLFGRVIPTGLAHGTVTVVQDGHPYEVTTLRGEGAYTDGRRPDTVSFVDDIREDLARRDFTVNAIAWDPHDGQLIDPFGGLQDLRNRRLRTVGSPDDRFAEDGLRVLRAARFVATLEFSLDPKAEQAIAGALGTFAKVSAERVRDEWLKALAAPTPSRAFELMRRTGILGVSCPELVQLHGCTQNRYHAYDVWEHSMVCMDACQPDPIHRLAGLLHDLGKPATRAVSERTGDYTFYNHERIGADMANAWLRRQRFSNDERKRVVHLVRHHLICYASEWSDAAVRRFVNRVGADHVQALLALGRADARAKGRPVEQELAQLAELERRITGLAAAGAAMNLRDLAVSGRDLQRDLGLRPSPLIGRILNQLLERVIDDPAANERNALMSLARSIVDAEGDSRS